MPLLGLVLAEVMVGSTVRSALEEQYRTELTREVGLGANILRLNPDAPPDSLADAINAAIGLRTTLVGPDGRVLGDSEVEEGALATVENHATRPEVFAAFADPTGGLWFDIRRSATMGSRLLYGARVVNLQPSRMVLRVAVPVNSIDETVWRIRRSVGLAGLGTVLLGLLIWATLTRTVLPPLEMISRKARRLAGGELEIRFDADSGVLELERTAGALNHLAEEVEGRMKELARERDEVQTLLDSIDEGILALTDDGRVLRTNKAFHKLLGIETTVPFSPIGTLIRQPNLRDLLEAAIVGPLDSSEIRVGKRDLVVSAQLLERGGSLVTFVDVTEIRRLEQVRSDFVANASHELKTPLTSMRGFAETLLDADPPEELRVAFLTSIRDNSVRLQHLVDDLLDLSRLESGGWLAREEEVEVADLVREIWEGSFARRGKNVGVTFALEGSALVLADERGLGQVFRNLFDNALRHSVSGGRLTVKIETKGPMARISVEDTGSGIPPELLSRVFERFFRGDPARSRAEGGTGLGLAIVRHMVQAMGGEVWAESELGSGTRITFTVPHIG